MTELPDVTVAPHTLPSGNHGWQATCTCGWRLEQINRPVVDLEAAQHRATCARRRG